MSHWILSSHITQHFPTHFVLSHSFPTFYKHTQTQNIPFVPPFPSFIFCWCNNFHPHSLSLFLLLSFSYIFLFTNRRTYIYASRQANRTIHPLQHWNCPQATLVRQHAVAFTSLLYTHIPPTPWLPPPRSKRCPSTRLSVCILPITCLSMFKLGECTCVCVWRYGLFLWQLGTPYSVGGCCNNFLGGEKTFSSALAKKNHSWKRSVLKWQYSCRIQYLPFP